jgi:phosphoadenosine phosphosulfate reductase
VALDGLPEDLLRHVVDRFHPRLYVACSFQKESSVLIDMLVRIQPDTRFFTIDTGVLFQETYSAWRALERHYGIRIDVYRGMTLADQGGAYGEALWERNPDRCCGIRKVEPLKEALAGVDAWITGLRRDQTRSRGNAPKLHWDDRHGLYKANPLADWTEQDIWAYIATHDVPYHELHDRGYASIGCRHCTRPGPGREGRWADRDKTECGMHAKSVDA